MDQIGKVIGVDGDEAVIELERNRACEKCGICHLGETNKLLLTANNEIGADIGQRVLVNMEDRSVLKAGMILYLMPLLALLSGFGLVYGFWDMLGIPGGPDWWAIGIGFVLFALAFVVIRKLEPVWKKNSDYTLSIVRVMEDYEEITDFCGHGDD
jgi:sigma-E factor negative regulatory protein RseC